jgi:hypothetical protein
MASESDEHVIFAARICSRSRVYSQRLRIRLIDEPRVDAKSKLRDMLRSPSAKAD